MTPLPAPQAAGVAPLSDDERLSWLRLIRSDNVGSVTFRDLLAHFGSAGAALDALPDLAGRSGRAIRICRLEAAERELAAAAKIDAKFIASVEPAYPPWLRAIDAAPPLVAVRGSDACLARPAVAIVGSRNSSIAGRKIAVRIAAGLGEAGFVVVSGLARGIDSAAHTAALPTGTVAVFAGGLDRPYPAENIPLAESIVEQGAHLSEMPMGWEPRARDFPRRNRVISGMAVGVVVVEAALRSGSLITARLAGEQGRLVFAVPGSPLDPRAGGANQLIRDGAILVTSVDDIIAEIHPMLAREPIQLQPDLPFQEAEADAAEPDLARLVAALGPTPVQIDEIIRFTGLAAAAVRLGLIELDLDGRIERHPGGLVSLVR